LKALNLNYPKIADNFENTEILKQFYNSIGTFEELNSLNITIDND
jgi:hypothetical protein